MIIHYKYTNHTTMAKLIRLISPGPHGVNIDVPKGSMKCKDEDWSISANTKEDNGTERELAQICIHFPDGVRWIGSIQDLRAIEHYAKNVFNSVIESQSPIIWQDEIKELGELLSHFKK